MSFVIQYAFRHYVCTFSGQKYIGIDCHLTFLIFLASEMSGTKKNFFFFFFKALIVFTPSLRLYI